MADVLVKPAFQSAATDTGDGTKLGPNAWNAARLFTGGNLGDVCSRDPASATGASWVAASGGGASDATLTFTDITTNNVSITKHGFAPKAPNDALKFLDGTGAWSVPAGSGANPAFTSVSLGTNPAAAGPLRLPNNAYITARNNANSADVNMFRVATGDAIEFGANLSSASFSISPLGVASGAHVTAAGTSYIGFGGRMFFRAPANAQLNVLDNAETSGVGFDVSTDATLKVRTRAQTADAQLSAASVRGNVVTFANRPATPVEGMHVAISDSSTATWGATITGGGANHVDGYYNGTNWVVS